MNDNQDFYRLNISKMFVEKTQKKKDIPNAWREAVEDSQMFLENYEKDVLIHFGEKMCFCTNEEIDEVYCNALYSLNCFKETAVENRNKKSKSTAAICVSLGTIIIMMFA